MMKRSEYQQGFTLLEVMVVVLIIATISGLSMLALNQASDRRYIAQADNLLAWLQQISELAVLEGVTYGLMQNEQALYGMVFYRQRWHRTTFPEPFQLYENAVLTLPESDSSNFFNASNDGDKDVLLPNIIMLSDGYMEPAVSIDLSFVDQTPAFSYLWDDQTSALIMENQGQSNKR